MFIVDMKLLIAASKNPIKIKAALNGFKKIFPNERFSIKSVDVESGVSDQPMSDEETVKGAQNRARNALQLFPKADFSVGIEGGAKTRGTETFTFAWVVVVSKTEEGKGRTASFQLPIKVAMQLKEGKELGDVMDEIFGKKNSKQQEGAIGILTDGVIDRTKLYTPAVIAALIPFKKKNLY